MIKFWLGSQESYDAFQIALSKGAQMKAQTAGYQLELPPVYELHGNVGVVKIEGYLDEGEAGIMRFFGMTGYQDIQNAIVQGIKDPKAKSLMVYSNSPGGNSKGLEQTSELLANAAQVKPMSAFADEANSAAYWLTSVAPHITLGRMGTAGSIGVLSVFKNYAKQLADEGIEVKVMRAGKYKALGNPYEAFSEEFLTETQEKLDIMYGMFTEQVAANRNTTVAVADTVMGQGRVFLGKQALEVGLVDAIGDMETALAYAKSNRNLANV